VCYNGNVLQIGDWQVNPNSGQISRGGQTARLEARTMRLLVCLAEHAGEVVSIDELIDDAWSGVTVSQDSVYQAVASLRRLLGDDPKQPTYIETVPRLGYRMVATVSDVSPALADSPKKSRRIVQSRLMWAAGAVLCVAVVVAFQFMRKTPVNKPSTSVAVLPFQDLTEQTTQEPFADGMTVELIDKLSKVPGLRVHAPMSSASLKGKRYTIAGMAKMIGVAYVVDGSVRKSGSSLRVVARLIHAEDEYVVWSHTYDRTMDDILKVQDDIAGEVTKALRASI
jgi:transcriptional activator of cad operon